MCLGNAEELSLTIEGWQKLFPDGLPDFFIDTNSLIDIQAWLPHIGKVSVKVFMRWAATKNAEIAKRRASFQMTGAFPLLDARLTDEQFKQTAAST